MGQHFTPSFLQQVPPDKLNETLKGLVPAGGLTATTVKPASPTQIVALVKTTQGPLQLGLPTGPDGLIAGLVFKPPPTQAATLTSWNELDQRLKRVAPRPAC